MIWCAFQIAHSKSPITSKNDEDIHARIGEAKPQNAHLFGLISTRIMNQTIVPINQQIAECAEMKSATLSATPYAVFVDEG